MAAPDEAHRRLGVTAVPDEKRCPLPQEMLILRERPWWTVLRRGRRRWKNRGSDCRRLFPSTLLHWEAPSRIGLRVRPACQRN